MGAIPPQRTMEGHEATNEGKSSEEGSRTRNLVILYEEEAGAMESNEDTEVVIIRDMALKDVATCYKLGMDLFAFNSSLSRTFDRFVVIGGYSSDPDFCLVAETKDRLIGFTVGNSITKDVVMGYLGWVAVHTDYQRAGIGSKLVRRVEERMHEQEINEVLVDTPTSNTSALRFLRKLGYGSPEEQVYLSHSIKRDESGLEIVHPPGLEHAEHAPRRSPESSSPLLARSLHEVKDNDTTQKVQIRLMQISDIWPVFQIGTQVFTMKSRNLYRFWDETQVTDAYESDGDLALVAELNGEVVGFALGSTLERVEIMFGYLIWLAVAPSAHGMGIGKLLYYAYEELIMENYPDTHTIILDTQASNKGAIRFFSRLGFQITDTFVYVCKRLPSGEAEADSSSDVGESESSKATVETSA